MRFWLRGLFQDERRYYRLLLVAGGMIAILKGMHMPYSWPATQAQIDYRYGFLRRGLFGEVCRQLHIPIWRYGVFAAVSFVLLGCFLLLLAWSVERSGLDEAGLGAFSALIAGSFCISFLMNVVGFYDIVMAILVLLVLPVRPPWLQLAAVGAAGILGVLVHELYAIAFLPVSLAGSVRWAENDAVRRWRRWLIVAAVFFLPWVLVFSIAHHAAMTPAQGQALTTAIRARVNFEPYDAMLQVLTFSSRDNLQLMLSFMHAGTWWVEEAIGAVAFIPTALLFLAIACRQAAARRPVVKLWLIASTFSPLLLNFVGFDRYRWLAMVPLNAFLSAIAMFFASGRLSSVNVAAPNPYSVAWRHAAVFLLAINLATDVGFFEGQARTFPFREYWTDYRSAQQEHRPWLQPPELFPKRSQ